MLTLGNRTIELSRFIVTFFYIVAFISIYNVNTGYLRSSDACLSKLLYFRSNATTTKTNQTNNTTKSVTTAHFSLYYQLNGSSSFKRFNKIKCYFQNKAWPMLVGRDLGVVDEGVCVFLVFPFNDGLVVDFKINLIIDNVSVSSKPFRTTIIFDRKFSITLFTVLFSSLFIKIFLVSFTNNYKKI